MPISIITISIWSGHLALKILQYYKVFTGIAPAVSWSTQPAFSIIQTSSANFERTQHAGLKGWRHIQDSVVRPPADTKITDKPSFYKYPWWSIEFHSKCRHLWSINWKVNVQIHWPTFRRLKNCNATYPTPTYALQAMEQCMQSEMKNSAGPFRIYNPS